MEKESNRLEKHYSNKESQRKRESMQGRGKIIKERDSVWKKEGGHKEDSRRKIS